MLVKSIMHLSLGWVFCWFFYVDISRNPSWLFWLSAWCFNSGLLAIGQFEAMLRFPEDNEFDIEVCTDGC